MNPLLVAPAVEIIKQLFSFGGSMRKEAIGIGAFAPAVASIYGTMQEHCLTQCTLKSAFFSVSGQQYSALIGAAVILFLHLNAKANDAQKNKDQSQLSTAD
jgi:hypothetical protein